MGGGEFVWLEIEAADDDPVRFVRRLVSALSTDRPGATQLAHLASMGAGGLGSTLLGDLSAELRSFPELVIVLDDVHHLSNVVLADIGPTTQYSWWRRAELAGLFFVSANTLKTHIAHIYRKLAVSGRSAAIVRARELGLLEPITPFDRAHG